MSPDPLFDELQKLPALTPSSALDVQIREEAAAILAGGRRPLGEVLFYRALIPMLLSGTTAAYLFWAFQAAIALY